MVVRAIGDDLKLDVTLTQVCAAQNPQLAQRFKGAIHSRQIDLWVIAASLGMNLLDAGVTVQLGQCLHNDLSLLGQPKAALPELLQQGKVVHHPPSCCKDLQKDYSQKERKCQTGS